MITRLLTARPARLVMPAVLMLMALAIASASFFSQLARVDEQARRETADDISGLALNQARRIDAQTEMGIEHALARLVGSLAFDLRVSGAWVVDADGRVVAALRRADAGRSFRELASRRPAGERDALVAAAFEPRAGRPAYLPDGRRLVVSRWVLLSASPSRYGMLVIEADCTPSAQALRAEVGRRFWIYAAGVLAVTVVLWWLLRTAWTERSRQLAEAAERLRLEGEDLRTDIGGGDEIARVARALEDASARIRRKARLLHVVSQASLAAQRLGDHEYLGRDICRLLVTEGGYALAGLATLRADGRTLAVDAIAGAGAGELAIPPADLDDPGQAGRLAVRALRSGEVIVRDDLDADPELVPWLQVFREAGLRAVAVVPLVEMGQPLGVFFLGARTPGAFDADFVAAAASMAADLSANIILRERQRQATEAEHRLAVALRAAGLGAWRFNLRTGENDVDARWFAMLGLDPVQDHARAREWRAMLHPDDVPLMERALARLEDPAVDNYDVVFRMRHADGHWVWIESRGRVLERDAAGRPLRLAGVHADVTARRRDEAQLRIAADAFAGSHEGILVCDGDGVIISVNAAFERVTGYSAAEVVGRRPSVLSSGHQGAEFYRAMWAEIGERGRWEGEIWNRRKSGEVYPEWLTISRIRHPDGRTNYLGQFVDITERKVVQSRLDELGRTDPLTGLSNRRAFVAEVERQLQGEAPGLAVLMFNIDRFRQVNDSLGFAAGDEALVLLARRLGEALGPAATLARVSGDEFAALLAGADEVAARDAAARVQLGLQEPLGVAGQRLVFSVSVGIALAPLHGTEAELLLVSAAAALGLAREEGLQQPQLYSPGLPGASLRRLNLESQLRLALQRDELFAVYQPQVSLATGELVGLEALVRWRHPSRGVVSPGEFIPVAVEAGLAAPIGDLMLRAACQALLRLRRAGLPPVPVSVNIEAGQLRRPDFMAQVVSEVERAGLPASALEIEITESMLMSDVPQTISLLAALRARGFRVAIDDFGTGYSSLSYLARLPLDRVKVDQSFVRDLRTSAAAEAVVRAVISLARSLGLNVLAEGVEEPEDAARLVELGCEDAQGYLYARPMPEDELLARFGRRLA